MSAITKFFVPGIPAPGGSKKAFVINGRAHITDDCKRNAPWRNSVAIVASSAHLGGPFTGPIILDVQFVMPRPKGHYRTGKFSGSLRASAPPEHTVKPDTTKLLRAVEDALTGICWRDDAQVCIQHVSKIYGDKTGAHVEIVDIEERAKLEAA